MSLGQSWNFQKEIPTKTIIPELKQNIKEEESLIITSAKTDEVYKTEQENDIKIF